MGVRLSARMIEKGDCKIERERVRKRENKTERRSVSSKKGVEEREC